MFKVVVVKHIQHLGAVGALNHRVIYLLVIKQTNV